MNAGRSRYPYLATLARSTFYEGSYIETCGASLIAPNLLLSAAHCQFGKAKEVHIGHYNTLLDTPEDYEVYRIQAFIMHPLFPPLNVNHPEHYNVRHDLMIVQIAGNSTRQLVRLNDNPDLPVPYQNLTVAGWGITDPLDLNSRASILQEVETMFRPHDDCRGIVGGDYSAHFLESPDFLCLRSNATNGGISCSGDSGSAVLHRPTNDSRDDIQVGVVSHGVTEICEEGEPDFSSSISDNWDWLRSTICNLAYDPPGYLNCSVVDVPKSTVTLAPVRHPDNETNSTGSDKVLVTIVIQLDSFSAEVGWRLTNNMTGLVVAEAKAGDYPEKEVFESPFDERDVWVFPGNYTFTIFDLLGDGFCCQYNLGYYLIYMGTDWEDPYSLLVHKLGNIGFERNQTIVISDRKKQQQYHQEATAGCKESIVSASNTSGAIVATDRATTSTTSSSFRVYRVPTFFMTWIMAGMWFISFVE